MKQNLARVIGIMALIIGAACGGTTINETSPDSDPLPVPPSTMPVIGWIQQCWNQSYARQAGYQAVDQACFSSGGTGCSEAYNAAIADDQNTRTVCMHELPAVSNECRDQFDPNSYTHDSDGDGISDADETWMFLNPCEKCSFGGFPEDCDGAQDWDDDGVNNTDDQLPRCPNDGGPLATNCV